MVDAKVRSNERNRKRWRIYAIVVGEDVHGRLAIYAGRPVRIRDLCGRDAGSRTVLLGERRRDMEWASMPCALGLPRMVDLVKLISCTWALAYGGGFTHFVTVSKEVREDEQLCRDLAVEALSLFERRHAARDRVEAKNDEVAR